MSDKPKRHAIQLRKLKVMELFLRIDTEKNQDKLPDSGAFNFYHGYSPFDEKENIIAIKVGISIDSKIDDTPFDLRVELVGFFEVDLENFSKEDIPKWATRNAPLILYPYLREQSYSLTNRAGYEGFLLPLFEIPVFKIIKTH